MWLQSANFTEYKVFILTGPEGIFFTTFNLCHKQEDCILLAEMWEMGIQGWENRMYKSMEVWSSTCSGNGRDTDYNECTGRMADDKK